MRGIERRRAISMSFREDNATLGNHAINMKDRAGNELLQQIERLLIADLIQPGPEFVGRMNLFHANTGGLRAGFEQPGTGNAGHEFPKTVVIEDVDEFGHEDARLAGPRAHGQLVAKIADRGETHTGNAEMLAQRRDILHVKFIKRDDAIDGMGSCRVTYGINQILQWKLFGHGEYFIDAFERPRCMAKFFDRQEKNTAAERLASADKFLTLFVGTDAENSERPFLQHATPPGNQVNRARIIQRPRARDTGIAETVRHARSASRAPASSLFREARRGTSPLPARCAGLRACRYPARCAGEVRRLPFGQIDE